MKKYSIITAILFSLLAIGCSEDYLETAPTASVTEADMLNSLTGAETVLDGINRATYTFGGAHDQFGQKSIDYSLDCLSDEFYPTERGYGWFFTTYQWKDHRQTNSALTGYVWAYYYDLINNANLIIKNVEPMTPETPADIAKRKSLLAQCYAYRGYSLYNLVQIYGENGKGVPVPTTPNPGSLARSSVDDVYTQIFTDLKQAVVLFTESGLKRKNVSQINIDVANAVLARVSLTRGQTTSNNVLLQDAIDYANAVIDGVPVVGGQFDLNWGYEAYKKFDLGETGMWNKANSEWVWGALLIDEQQTSYASFFSHMDNAFGGYSQLGNHKVMASVLYDFIPATDIRKVVNTPSVYLPSAYAPWFKSKPRTSFKYTGMGEWTNDYLYIKLGEMYLIVAEASYRLGDEGPALDALNELNENRFVGNYFDETLTYTDIASTGPALLDDILMYRRAELWGDGQRFFDMKRLGIGNEGRLEQPLKESTHLIPAGDKQFNFLIPKQEMDANPLMVQNEL